MAMTKCMINVYMCICNKEILPLLHNPEANWEYPSSLFKIILPDLVITHSKMLKPPGSPETTQGALPEQILEHHTEYIKTTPPSHFKVCTV
jgi:hypothetical protein